jgi:hypothetical protein
MFGLTVRKIDFDWIDFVKLILAKIDFKLKWFMFGIFMQKWVEQEIWVWKSILELEGTISSFK